MGRKEILEKIEYWYRDMYSGMYFYARKILGDSSWAEEAVQETFRIACGKMEELDASLNPKGWLMNSLKNVLRNIQRNRAVIGKIVMETAPYEDYLKNKQSRNVIEEDLDLNYSDMIPSEDFYILKKLAMESCTVKELAKELGISYEACKKRVQRARKRMEEELRKIQG